MKKIYHIYWGTSGNSGLYLDEIYQVLKNNGYNQRVFVNYYYPFDYGNKVFFKRGDVANSKYKDAIRKIFQLIEILKGYFIILCYSIKERPSVINYSHVGQSYLFIVWFLKVLKFVSGAKLVITCHDVMPFTDAKSEMVNRKKIFKLAYKLLVHNSKSIVELAENFDIDKSNVVIHPFPLMDLTKISVKSEKVCSKVDFLFIGHLRKAKGIQFLLDLWTEFHQLHPEATLRICGQQLDGVTIDKELLEKCNVDLHLHFISDDDYYHYVKAARFVILPYLRGTNSGIISTVLSLGTDVITSDLPMFAENALVGSDDMFTVGNKTALFEKLAQKLTSSSNQSFSKINEYRKNFTKEVLEVYSKLEQ